MTGTRKKKPVSAEARATGDAPREAWALLVKLFRNGQASHSSACSELDLTSAQAHVLETLDPSKPVPMCILAGSLACDASNVTGLVDKLEVRGLLERKPDPTDRRIKMVALTPSGKRLRTDLVSRLSKPPSSITSLSRDDHLALVRILRQATAESVGESDISED